MNVGNRLTALREEKGLTQYELANELGISKSVMNRIELGTRPIRDDDELIKFLNFSVFLSTIFFWRRKRYKTPQRLK